ncbi:MAG: hypothetical protein EZS28_018379 [Streblomastix strix]|uniref:Uncharacterized protein n=1 Tax=Streblomastix strix TaxID=222440 RepID=A0A5J4VTZ8_9EUKA|nr:MAG: hypothetical protein EZS28_018379 [Streblomastix strix]
MQLQATINGEANSENYITITSVNTPLHNANGSDELGGNGCGTQLPVSTNQNGHQTIKQSITLAMKTITSKLMIIELEEIQTNKNSVMKANMNQELNIKIMEVLNLKGLDHFTQLILNKNKKIQTFHNPKTGQLQSTYLQNQAKLQKKQLNPKRGRNQKASMILEANMLAKVLTRQILKKS